VRGTWRFPRANAFKLLQPVKNQLSNSEFKLEATEKMPPAPLLTQFSPVQNSDLFCQVTSGGFLARELLAMNLNIFLADAWLQQ
jgi:hypothetical protein